MDIRQTIQKKGALRSLTAAFLLSVFAFCLFLINQRLEIISPIADPAIEAKSSSEVFGFAPHWKLDSLDNVDFNVLTTLAYFGVPILPDGNLDDTDIGYAKLDSDTAQRLFEKAHNHGTRVVLTLTLMDNGNIKAFLTDKEAQDRAVRQAISLVKKKDMDGINIDVEYTGNPGPGYADRFTVFVKKMNEKLHSEIPGSHLSVSVYASSAKDEKLYDIGQIAANADAIFMMAYDFATTGSDQVIPTSPLYGHKEGEYWYDISTAVEDFLVVMPAEKLILGLPWYGYNYPVVEPGVKVDKYSGYYYTYWRNYRRYTAFQSFPSNAQTYASASDIQVEASGWDKYGQVGWIAYREGGIWRMIFLDDERSLKIKYQFAKDKKLGGVGIWALGFDEGKTEMWSLLDSEFGVKLASKDTE